MIRDYIYEALSLHEEEAFGKTYLFRGESRNNYHNMNKLDQASRFFAYELFDGIQDFGAVAVYELLDSSKILNYNDDIDSFIEEYSLRDEPSAILKKLYKVNTIAEMEDKAPAYADDEYTTNLFHAKQLVATTYLENNSNYDGIVWYEPYDEPQIQIQIWNFNILRRLSYKEAKALFAELSKTSSNYDLEHAWYDLKKN